MTKAATRLCHRGELVSTGVTSSASGSGGACGARWLSYTNESQQPAAPPHIAKQPAAVAKGGCKLFKKVVPLNRMVPDIDNTKTTNIGAPMHRLASTSKRTALFFNTKYVIVDGKMISAIFARLLRLI